MFDVCTTGDTAHIDTIFKFLPHTRVNMGASIFFTAAMIRAFRSARSRGNGGTNTRSLTYPKEKKSQGVTEIKPVPVIFIRQLLYYLDAVWFKDQTLTQNAPHCLFSTSIAPWLQFPLISSDYAETWPEPVQRNIL
jgi:hypothetical protein